MTLKAQPAVSVTDSGAGVRERCPSGYPVRTSPLAGRPGIASRATAAEGLAREASSVSLSALLVPGWAW
jgi:hypothetical protein